MTTSLIPPKPHAEPCAWQTAHSSRQTLQSATHTASQETISIMPNDTRINTHDVQNLVSGDVGGDQVGGDKVMGDQIAGNKITIQLHNTTFDALAIKQLHATTSDENTEDLERICQLVSSMILKGPQTRFSVPTSSPLAGLREIRHALERFHTLHYTGTLDTSKTVCEMRFSDLPPLTITSVLVDPEATLRHHTSMRNIRRRKGGTVPDLFLGSRRVRRWAVDPRSSLACAKGSFSTRHIPRDFSVGILNWLVKEGVQTAWILQSKGSNAVKYDAIDVLKQLVSQILHLNPTMLNERSASLTAARSREACSLDDWFTILGSVLVDIKQVYMFVDLDVLDLHVQDHHWSERFARLIDEMQKRQIPTVVKAVLLSCRKSEFTPLRDGQDVAIDVRSPRVIKRLQSHYVRTSK